jgi:hypothetical protein
MRAMDEVMRLRSRRSLYRSSSHTTARRICRPDAQHTHVGQSNRSAGAYLSMGRRERIFYFFFLVLQQVCQSMKNASLNTRPYLEGHAFNGTFLI